MESRCSKLGIKRSYDFEFENRSLGDGLMLKFPTDRNGTRTGKLSIFERIIVNEEMTLKYTMVV